MAKNSLLSWLAGTVVAVVVIVVLVVIWSSTTPKSKTATLNPDLIPLKTDQISKDALSQINALQKNGDIPVTNAPSDLGRDNPFAGL